MSDDELAASLEERDEWRRQGLSVLVGRLRPNDGGGGAGNVDLVDTLFALTSFEMFKSLSVRNRTATAVEGLIVSLADLTLSGAPRGGSAG